jgi:hypothetical protein
MTTLLLLFDKKLSPFGVLASAEVIRFLEAVDQCKSLCRGNCNNKAINSRRRMPRQGYPQGSQSSKSFLPDEAFAFSEECRPKHAALSGEIENGQGRLPLVKSEDELASLEGFLEVLGANGFVSLFPHCERESSRFALRMWSVKP